MTTRRLALSGLFLLSAMIVAGCGQKGTLYLPDDAPPALGDVRPETGKEPAESTEATN